MNDTTDNVVDKHIYLYIYLFDIFMEKKKCISKKCL